MCWIIPLHKMAMTAWFQAVFWIWWHQTNMAKPIQFLIPVGNRMMSFMSNQYKLTWICQTNGESCPFTHHAPRLRTHRVPRTPLLWVGSWTASATRSSEHGRWPNRWGVDRPTGLNRTLGPAVHSGRNGSLRLWFRVVFGSVISGWDLRSVHKVDVGCKLPGQVQALGPSVFVRVAFSSAWPSMYGIVMNSYIH